MVLTLALTATLLAQSSAVSVPPEAKVGIVLEDLRKAELMLDADALSQLIAASFTQVDQDGRIVGAFAFLEPVRRARAAHRMVVDEVAYEDVLTNVFGASAVATYRCRKSWREGGRRHREESWTSDVFELRDDGAWILVHRHRTPTTTRNAKR